MQRDPVTVSPDDSIETVLRTLREHELPGVPVTNKVGRPVGIITESDLILSEENADLHLPTFINLFGGVVFLEPLKHFEARIGKAFASKAEDMMTKDPITVAPQASISEAARIIAEHGHNRLLVAEHGRLVGVVTRVNVLEELVNQ